MASLPFLSQFMNLVVDEAVEESSSEKTKLGMIVSHGGRTPGPPSHFVRPAPEALRGVHASFMCPSCPPPSPRR